MKLVKIDEGDGPIILTQPHGGTYIPNYALNNFNKAGLQVSDTDWHINKLYNGLLKSASVVQALFSRNFIDANRDPSGKSLYLKLNSTELCPTKNFLGKPIYKKGMEPDSGEIEKRLKNFHSIYHNAILRQIHRVKRRHGLALVFDCHSIKSNLPFLFKGSLPDLNLGTNDGITCDPVIEEIALKSCSKIIGYKFVLNGRFKGGWTIRNYGQPKESIHSIQLELSQRIYMQENFPWNYDLKKAKKIRKFLKILLNSLESHLTKA
tara:strand:+ start:1047 stop:1838 length:792 start_codon:yes stop_codon:yes gene_type:complete